MVDDVQTDHYDSNTKRAEPKQDWMNKVTADDPQYWEIQTQIAVGEQQAFKANIETLKRRFNQTGGLFVSLSTDEMLLIALFCISVNRCARMCTHTHTPFFILHMCFIHID